MWLLFNIVMVICWLILPANICAYPDACHHFTSLHWGMEKFCCLTSSTAAKEIQGTTFTCPFICLPQYLCALVSCSCWTWQTYRKFWKHAPKHDVSGLPHTLFDVIPVLWENGTWWFGDHIPPFFISPTPLSFLFFLHQAGDIRLPSSHSHRRAPLWRLTFWDIKENQRKELDEACRLIWKSHIRCWMPHPILIHWLGRKSFPERGKKAQKYIDTFQDTSCVA